MTIGQDIVARARARAAECARTRAPTSRRLAQPGPVRTPEEAVRRIADDMLDIAGVSGSADEAALLNRGWTMEALRKFGERARDLANRAAVRRA